MRLRHVGVAAVALVALRNAIPPRVAKWHVDDPEVLEMYANNRVLYHSVTYFFAIGSFPVRPYTTWHLRPVVVVKV